MITPVHASALRWAMMAASLLVLASCGGLKESVPDAPPPAPAADLGYRPQAGSMAVTPPRYFESLGTYRPNKAKTPGTGSAYGAQQGSAPIIDRSPAVKLTPKKTTQTLYPPTSPP